MITGPWGRRVFAFAGPVDLRKGFDGLYVKRLLKRRKYRCQCNACVVTAPASPRVIPGGRYSPESCLQVVAD